MQQSLHDLSWETTRKQDDHIIKHVKACGLGPGWNQAQAELVNRGTKG